LVTASGWEHTVGNPHDYLLFAQRQVACDAKLPAAAAIHSLIRSFIPSFIRQFRHSLDYSRYFIHTLSQLPLRAFPFLFPYTTILYITRHPSFLSVLFVFDSSES
jgi:hypothetical protein